MFRQLLEKDLKKAVSELGFTGVDIVLSIPENEKFGDYSSNVALQLPNQNGKKSYQNPRDIANEIVEKLGHPSYLGQVEIAGPGFINFYLKDRNLIISLASQEPPTQTRKEPKRILVEYGQPNTHKPLHIGHFRTLFIGESISRLLEYQGAEVFRVSYGSDIGPTVAKALWGIKKLPDEYEQAKVGSLIDKANFLGKAYAYGHKNYEEDENAKAEIDQLTIKLYQRDAELLPIWEETKQWSIAYFDSVYAALGTEFDRIIPESEIEAEGKEIVKENIGKVFIEDQGAIIFPGEKYGLHNRVFITSKGNPTYEAKELGITRRYQEIFPFDESIHIVDNQQTGFFKVVTKAIEMLEPKLIGRKKHLSYGFVTLTTGKMSSRTGNVITGDNLIDQIKSEIIETYGSRNTASDDIRIEKLALAAIKFFYLKFGITSDIVFDIKQSIALHGDTGPYLMYAYARTGSILEKAEKSVEIGGNLLKSGLNPVASQSEGLEVEERLVLRSLEYFDYYVTQAANNFQPNELANYLLSLAKTFNLFYEKWPILGSGDKQEFRLSLVTKVGETLKLGLYLLGIETVDKM